MMTKFLVFHSHLTILSTGRMKSHLSDFIQWWLVISIQKYSPRNKEELYLKTVIWVLKLKTAWLFQQIQSSSLLQTEFFRCSWLSPERGMPWKLLLEKWEPSPLYLKHFKAWILSACILEVCQHLFQVLNAIISLYMCTCGNDDCGRPSRRSYGRTATRTWASKNALR